MFSKKTFSVIIQNFLYPQQGFTDMHRDVSNRSFLIGVLKKYMQTQQCKVVWFLFTHPARSLCTELYMLVSPSHRISVHFRHASVGARKVTGLWQVSRSMAHISIMYFLGSCFSEKIWEMKKPYFSVAWTFISLLSISHQWSEGWWRYHIACRIRTLIIHTAWSIEGWQDNPLKLFSWQLAAYTWAPVPRQLLPWVFMTFFSVSRLWK